MLLDGNSRGGGNDLAIHLMKPENERVEIIEMRGFLADNLKDAFLESCAISKGTRCKKHLFRCRLTHLLVQKLATRTI